MNNAPGLAHRLPPPQEILTGPSPSWCAAAPAPRRHINNAPPSYYILGGLVFTPVTVPLLRSEYGKVRVAGRRRERGEQ